MTPATFRVARQRLGLTQAELAGLLGFADANQIHRMETGRRGITPRTADRLRTVTLDLARVSEASQQENNQ